MNVKNNNNLYYNNFIYKILKTISFEKKLKLSVMSNLVLLNLKYYTTAQRTIILVFLSI